MIPNTNLSSFLSKIFSSNLRRNFWFAVLQLVLATAFVFDTWHWLDRAATGVFWRYPLVHGVGMVVLGIYSVLAARSIARIVRRMIVSDDILAPSA